MSSTTQIFQTTSPWRWRTIKWLGRTAVFLLIMIVPVVIITLVSGIQPALPLLSGSGAGIHRLSRPTVPNALNATQLKRYKGYIDYLKTAGTRTDSLQRIRAGFYVDWDPQSFYSLQKNIDKLNLVIPEWFFIDPATDTLAPKVDTAALELMRKHNVKIVPLINNINESLGEGEFDGPLIHRILHNPAKKERLISDMIRYLRLYRLQGINVDFEEFKEKSDEPIIAFQKELYERLHREGFIVSQDIMASDEDFNVKALAQYNDYLCLMDYDEHYNTSVPGPISSQKWLEKNLDEASKEIPSAKIILCLAAYGYDWPEDEAATTVTYQEALADAAQFRSTVQFDDDTYSNDFSYLDGDSVQHRVFFNDAATNFNTVRFADEYGTAGTAIWRLGSEDERLWTFYDRSLTNESLRQKPFDFQRLTAINPFLEKPDYIGDGEILDVISRPAKGNIRIETDSAEGIVSEEQYKSLPTQYVIRKYGRVKNQVVLTFDDGPDETYTPQILDILKKEKVPAAFFVVGVQAEQNLPLLRRIYDEGHEIGNHTFTHPNIATVSDERATAEMESTRLLIEAETGRSTVLFRAPFNADAEPSTEVELKPIALSKQKNYYTVGESIDPNDWDKGVSADTIYNRVVRQYEANPEKGIILLHDAGGDRQATVRALPRIIQYFKSRGVQFTTVANLLHSKKDVIMPLASNHLLRVDRQIAGLGYWTTQLLSTAFWVAIVLGLGRIAFMAVLAIGQKNKSRRFKYTNSGNTPLVSIIVPAYNEEVNAISTINSLLGQDYLLLDVIFVDDGSKDSTYLKVKNAFAGNDRVSVLTKPNGGKASALNHGIAYAKSDFVVCIDADTQLRPDAVTMLMRSMLGREGSGHIGAVAGNVKVGNEKTMLTRWQSIEYITSQNFDRRAFDLINGITVIPGAIGAFRKEAIIEAGGFTSDTLAEDCDLTIRLLRRGYRVVSCPDAVAVTEAPETLTQFMKQRFRWCYGIMQSFWKNRDACFNPKYKGLGMVALPNILIFQIILPMIAPLADLMLIVSLIWNRSDPESTHKIGLYYGLFLLIDVMVSVIAFAFERERLSKLVWLIPQRLVYRQLMYFILFKAIRKALKGEGQGWGVLKRTGNVTAPITNYPPLTSPPTSLS